jgi:hypothetical protein
MLKTMLLNSIGGDKDGSNSDREVIQTLLMIVNTPLAGLVWDMWIRAP